MSILLPEIAFIVNERPLTHAGGADELEPMTPHFLVGLQVGESNTAEKGLNAQFVSKRY